MSCLNQSPRQATKIPRRLKKQSGKRRLSRLNICRKRTRSRCGILMILLVVRLKYESMVQRMVLNWFCRLINNRGTAKTRVIRLRWRNLRPSPIAYIAMKHRRQWVVSLQLHHKWVNRLRNWWRHQLKVQCRHRYPQVARVRRLRQSLSRMGLINCWPMRRWRSYNFIIGPRCHFAIWRWWASGRLWWGRIVWTRRIA